VRDELEQLLDDDDDMADLYLSRKLAGASSPVSGSVATNWGPGSPTIGSKISRASRASAATIHGNENDVEELEMLLEAYFMQIDGTLNKLTTGNTIIHVIISRMRGSLPSMKCKYYYEAWTLWDGSTAMFILVRHVGMEGQL
ncbi:magnesium transporter MRS2-I-like, partial [Dendrobium catenatum]|uniref:magnesium transporter MRS2-I-like n=1 Tax=Dendrobium catenatum TaxID=906689 RepID=UPI0010A00E1A